ncbi:MAG: DUF3592 domain-containing protein [Fimbriimonadaceae bacterium]|nr:DUF3592 domain-containing protein [Chitinophagales bacterium]
MSTTTLLIISAAALLYYYFVLRRFNALGFRLFSLFTFIAIAFACWIYQDEKTLSFLQKNGEHVNATIQSKEKIGSETTSSPDYAVTISFANKKGEVITQQTHEYISEKEWNSFSENTEIEIIYDTASKEAYIAKSLERFKNDKWVLYVVAGFFFLIGCGCWFFLRKYKVGVDDKGNEWVEKDGKVYLDERNNKTAQVAKRTNIISKLLQAYRK